jgi:hypothetical protein
MTNKKKSNGTWQQTIFSLMIESPSGKKDSFLFPASHRRPIGSAANTSASSG